MPLPRGQFAARYERLREQALGGGDDQPLGMAVVLRQGLWAWMILARAQRVDDVSAARAVVPSVATSPPPCPPATVRGELIAAWTNLVVGAVTHQELHP